MTIAITGATGQLGRLVIDKLKAKGHGDTLVGLARSPEKASNLGITVREADYERRDLLDAALGGVDTLLLISSSEIGKRAAQHQNVIDAAVAAGVKWIVYTSLLHADTSTLSLAAEHLATEKALAASGIPHTILRNGWYTENYMASVAPALQHGAFIGSAGEGKISSAARADYAEALAVVLTGTGHEGKTYELSGDEAYTLADLAVELSAQSGKTTPYVNMTEADYARALKAAGLPEPMAAAYASFDTAAAGGALYDEGKQLSKLIERPTTPLSVSVSEAIKANS